MPEQPDEIHKRYKPPVFHDLNDLVAYIEERRRRTDGLASIGVTTGCYDGCHAGHVDMLRNAAKRCDLLVVAVTPNEDIERRKNRTPAFDQDERVHTIANGESLGVGAIYAPVGDDVSKLWPQLYQALRPEVLFVGEDHKGENYDVPEKTRVEALKSHVKVRTSDFIRRIRNNDGNDGVPPGRPQR